MQMRTAELNRLKTARYTARERIQKHLEFLEQELADVEREINELMQQSEELSAARKLLMSVPGVGPVTANILLIRLPEILTLGPKAVAALAGRAPMANQSGSKDRRRRIHGGRQDVRNVLYSVGDALQPSHQAFLSAADSARQAVQGRAGGGHAQASMTGAERVACATPQRFNRASTNFAQGDRREAERRRSPQRLNTGAGLDPSLRSG